ncbi:MAG: protein kinase [Minicystis sp.]
MQLHPGAVIAGRYRLERKIGSGGMGEVWAGEHVAIGVRVALKTLLPAAAVDQQVVARFRREAYLLGRVRSDRVARVVDFIEDRRFGLVLVMDFVEGEPLANVLEARCLNVEETIDLAVDIMTAVCDLHRAKVVHRDLKPDNIILEPLPGGGRRAVIVDFGVSRMESGDGEEDHDQSITSITQADVAVGTIPYMAPEQFLSSRDVTGAADVYAVGAILFRALSGQHVYGDTEDMDYAKKKLTTRAPPLSITRFDRVGRGLQTIVARALERIPDARFDSAEAMLQELIALRDVARATALDLDATTEQAPPPSSVAEGSSEDAAEPTRLMSRPPEAPEDIFDERTIESPGPIPSEPPPASPRVITPLIPRPAESSPGPVSAPASLPATLPAAVLASLPPPRGRVFSLQAMLIAIVAALLAGLIAGFEAHRLFHG